MLLSTPELTSMRLSLSIDGIDWNQKYFSTRFTSEKQFKFEVNEISWNKQGDLFFITTGFGTVLILNYPELQEIHTIEAHLANCICLEFDKTGKYFATGSADALTSLWDVSTLTCLRTYTRLEWPVRTLSFNHDSQLLASASEDHFIDISHVESGEQVASIKCETSTFTIAWHPKYNILGDLFFSFLLFL